MIVYLDANVIISAIETKLSLTKGQARLIAEIDAGKTPAATSELSLTECLVYPFRLQNPIAVDRFLAFLSDRPTFRIFPVARPILLRAARLRADTGQKLPDAIHLATAIESGCTDFITNDRDFSAVGADVDVVLWDAL